MKKKIYTNKILNQEIFQDLANIDNIEDGINYSKIKRKNFDKEIYRGKIIPSAGSIGGWDIGKAILRSAGEEIILDSGEKRIDIGSVLRFIATEHGGLIKFRESGVEKVTEYWDINNDYWGAYPAFGGYAYAGISMNLTNLRLALTHPGNSPYIQMGFYTKQITFHCDETTDVTDFFLLPDEIRLSRDYIDIG